MQALVKTRAGLELLDLSCPRPGNGSQVLISVRAAGICRMDVYAAQGRIPVPEPLILGHEFSGIIADVGANGFSPGERVAVDPGLPGQNFLGLNRDGAFADYVLVPASALYALPAQLSFLEGAYLEPVAAVLGILKTGIDPKGRGLIYGDNRIARLIARVLQCRGFDSLDQAAADQADRLEQDAYDFVIESHLEENTVSALLRALRPGGKMILRSRFHARVYLPLQQAIEKEVTFHAAGSGSFAEAIAMLAKRELVLNDLLGTCYGLHDFQTAFDQAARNESQKSFFVFPN